MEQTIPQHHVKQEICASRPAYREGRIPKAVKVYTVNNESKHILIQGVPSVGAMKELIQLCSSYGEIEEHHALDEYPCEDKYTEVYLVRYKKIQSARFAKRKLDEYSFFGGNLHVCYAPEYETVAQTREKLQERRRIVAAKIRQHKNERNQEQAIPSGEPSACSTNQLPNTDRDSAINQSPAVSGNERIKENENNLHHSYSQAGSTYSSVNENIAGSCSYSPHSFPFELPPPPRPSLNKQTDTKQKYEYSRVPSKHSTLPVGFDGRLEHNNQQNELQQTIPPQSQESELSTSTQSVESGKIIRKDYKPAKPVLKFVPRQAVKRTANKSGIDQESSKNLDKEIRKSAFVLSAEQGPEDLPGRRENESEITPGASSSYYKTIRSIRNKISKVITESVNLQK